MLFDYVTWLIPAAIARAKGGCREGEGGGPRGNGFVIEVLRPNSVPG